MSSTQMKDTLIATALSLGILVPLLYFGKQIVAATYFPGYDWMSQSASELGTEASRWPAIFNVGSIANGVIALCASVGLLFGLRRVGTSTVWCWLTALSVASLGWAALRGGLYPMPDPRHNPGPLGIGMFLIAPLYTIALWKLRDAQLLKAYFIANMFIFAVLFAVRAGIAGISLQGYEGAFQRVFAMVVFVPIGVGAYAVLRRMSRGVE